MADFNNDNKFVLFKKDNKEKESQPDYTGSGTVICEECGHANKVQLAAWLKTAKDGVMKFLGGAFSKPFNRDEGEN
jgi:hypothetical protein